MHEPLAPSAVKTLLVQILEHGTVEFSGHARKEMETDNIAEGEVGGVLKGCMAEPGELQRGSWRYRVRKSGVYAVVAFRSEDWTVVVTAWRKK